MMRSATASPTPIPKIHSAARLKVCPATAPTETTAAMAATNGRSCPSSSVAADHARVAARAVWITGHIPARKRPTARCASRRAAEKPSRLATARAPDTAITHPLSNLLACTRRRRYSLTTLNYSNTLHVLSKGLIMFFSVLLLYCCQAVTCTESDTPLICAATFFRRISNVYES
jgi:hypothetical protein